MAVEGIHDVGRHAVRGLGLSPDAAATVQPSREIGFGHDDHVSVGS
jgi:hypothetical protein